MEISLQIFSSLVGGKNLKLDLAHAYSQIELEEESTRLPQQRTSIATGGCHFGSSHIPENDGDHLASIQHVQVRIDDSIVTGKTVEEHLRILEVLS